MNVSSISFAAIRGSFFPFCVHITQPTYFKYSFRSCLNNLRKKELNDSFEYETVALCISLQINKRGLLSSFWIYFLSTFFTKELLMKSAREREYKSPLWLAFSNHKLIFWCLRNEFSLSWFITFRKKIKA